MPSKGQNIYQNKVKLNKFETRILEVQQKSAPESTTLGILEVQYNLNKTLTELVESNTATF